jgi:hypothetical protein
LRVEPLYREILTGVADPEVGPERVRLDVGVIPWFEDERPLQGLAGFVDWRCSGMLSALVRSGWCSGASTESVLMPGRPGLPVHRLVMIGLGRAQGLTRAAASRCAARAVEITCRLQPRSVLFAMPGSLHERELIEGVFSGLMGQLAGEPPSLRAVPSARDPAEVPWWVIADARHVARLRRLLDGPPRAADD